MMGVCQSHFLGTWRIFPSVCVCVCVCVLFCLSNEKDKRRVAVNKAVAKHFSWMKTWTSFLFITGSLLRKVHRRVGTFFCCTASVAFHLQVVFSRETKMQETLPVSRGCVYPPNRRCHG